jgi:hypothetical protein
MTQRQTGQTVRAVRAGTPIVEHVDGGVVRRRATADGIVIEDEETTRFISVEGAASALVKLGYVVLKEKRR